MNLIEPPILASPVAGLNVRAGLLRREIASPATLIVFLRHLGCMFCREMVADLRAAAATGAFPPVLLVSQSPADVATDYFARHWPAARVICDPDRTLYAAFGVARASFGGMIGPAVWGCAIRARNRGHSQRISQTFTSPYGDPWLLSAMFLAAPDGAVSWFHRARFPGERADYSSIPWHPTSDIVLPPLPT